MDNATRIEIDGMHCDACERRVRQGLEKLPGVTVKSVKVGEAIVDRDPDRADETTLRTVVEAQGFNVTGIAPAA